MLTEYPPPLSCTLAKHLQTGFYPLKISGTEKGGSKRGVQVVISGYVGREGGDEGSVLCVTMQRRRGGQILLSAEQAGITLITELREEVGRFRYLFLLAMFVGQGEGDGGSVQCVTRVDLSAVQRRRGQILLSAEQAGITLITELREG